MLPPLYLLLLLWPACPLIPARHKVVKPTPPNIGTRWLIQSVTSPVPLHVKYRRWYLNAALGVSPSLLGHPSAAFLASARRDAARSEERRRAWEKFIGAGRPSPMPDIIVIDEVDVPGVDVAQLRRMVELALSMPPACVEYITTQKSPPPVTAKQCGVPTPPRSRLARAVRAVQNYRTPRTGQKPWRRPRGLSSAARRRQNTRRKHK